MAIRVTHGWQVQANIQRLTSSRSSIAQLQEQAYSGKRLERASDGPLHWNMVETLSSNQRDQGQYTENSSRAQSILGIADNTLGSVSNIIKRVKELAIGAASEASVAEYHSAALTEVDSLKEQLVGFANQDYAGRYIFAGTAYDAPPYDATGTYSGATDEPSVQVSRQSQVLQGLDGSTVFNGPVDIFGMMDDLSTALAAEDADGVFDLIDEVDGALDQVLRAQQRVGTNQRRSEDLGEVAAQVDITLQELISEKVDADPIGIYTRINAMQSTYEATLQISAGAFQRSLFQFL